MIPIQAYLATSHIEDLRREADAARLARLLTSGEADLFDGGPTPPRRGPDLRRSLALAALQLSRLADGAAQRLDPCLKPNDAFGRRATGIAGR